MILLIAGTASGGHFFPAFSLGQALRFRGQEVKLTVFGEKHFEVADSWIVHMDSLKSFTRFIAKHKGDIDAVISFGSRHVVLPSIMAKRKIGTLWVHEQNVVPGRANKVLFHFADKILLTFHQCEPFIPSMFYKKLLVVGYPVREIYEDLSGEQLRKRWNIPSDAKVVVFSGGSKGAVEINVIASSFIRQLKDKGINNVFVIWQRGKDDMRMFDSHGVAVGFTSDLMHLFSIADLIVSRAGAGTIAEILSLNKKALLVPLRGVAGDHQYFNAIYSGFPVHRIDDLTFDTIYDALSSEENLNESKISIMDYDSLLNLIGGRE
ncbi:hypothetical protein GM182_03720 [bacterium 3DAC]|nr:hypothetical protein [Dictyoglomota bacterium]UZN23013.1 hypothetical protein GM182_03720 [bacterium 3DAC]